jgi:hypothetical protein
MRLPGEMKKLEIFSGIEFFRSLCAADLMPIDGGRN